MDMPFSIEYGQNCNAGCEKKNVAVKVYDDGLKICFDCEQRLEAQRANLVSTIGFSPQSDVEDYEDDD